ncbi:MAG TPA: tetratricopeptide repeat protein [Deltaproteobacteria bacterium]|nr:tetratricopeptide repeat protein [Deltaproteobacteria bacterium]
MRNVLCGLFCLSVLLFAPLPLIAQDLSQADALFDTGSIENLKQSAELYVKALEANPSSYEAAWKASRSYREYANTAKQLNVDGWEAICKEYGKLGMNYGERAIELNPDAIDGYFWYGCSVGNYSDGVSILTALKEGLKNKTQESFEKSYELDKMYVDGGPMKALGRFWFVLPWPLAKKDLALDFLREFQQSFPDDPEGQVFLAEVLIDKKEKEEARALLEKTAASDETYFADWAKRLLADLK